MIVLTLNTKCLSWIGHQKWRASNLKALGKIRKYELVLQANFYIYYKNQQAMDLWDQIFEIWTLDRWSLCTTLNWIWPCLAHIDEECILENISEHSTSVKSNWNFDPIMALDKKSGDPLGAMNICSIFHCISSNNSQYISLWTTNVSLVVMLK